MITAPVEGSQGWPAWMARVPNPPPGSVPWEPMWRGQPLFRTEEVQAKHVRSLVTLDRPCEELVVVDAQRKIVGRDPPPS